MQHLRMIRNLMALRQGKVPYLPQVAPAVAHMHDVDTAAGSTASHPSVLATAVHIDHIIHGRFGVRIRPGWLLPLWRRLT